MSAPPRPTAPLPAQPSAPAPAAEASAVAATERLGPVGALRLVEPLPAVTRDASRPAVPVPPLAELREFARLHARAQGLDPALCRRIDAELAREAAAAPDDDLLWPRTWAAHARAAVRGGRALEASRLYALARFPFAADDERRAAAVEGPRAFDTWRRQVGGIDRFEVDLPGGRVAAWTAGLDRPRRGGRRRPLVLVMGGIVSVKEQWAPFLRAADRLGAAVVVTEMPSVGENTLVYGPDSAELIPGLLDRFGAEACAGGVHVVGLSFSGHLALTAAATDPRISGVYTVGAPVSGVFADPDVWAALPVTTTATLAHLSATAPADTPALLAPMALTPERLRATDVRIRYVASRRDEIIPRREWELLAEHGADVEWVEFDDVHGSPAHLADTRLWLIRQLLTAFGDPRHRAVGTLLALRGTLTRTGRATRPAPTPALGRWIR